MEARGQMGSLPRADSSLADMVRINNTNLAERSSTLTDFISPGLVGAGLVMAFATGAEAANQFPSRFLLFVQGGGYSITMDFAPASEDMQWRVLIKCVSGSTTKQYWATAKVSGGALIGQTDGRKAQNFILDSDRMLLSVSPGQCRGGKAKIIHGIDE